MLTIGYSLVRLGQRVGVGSLISRLTPTRKSIYCICFRTQRRILGARRDIDRHQGM